MYFCLTCQTTHHLQETKALKLFRTGFRTFPDGEQLPLGVCMKRLEQELASNKKVS
ncbi:hypothetical protein [Tumebacillus algifaecis]|uniref:hypothetical protein n=1 Tax=Tumebacillus algifaecis TaxID=1214604 RepID=UPI0012FD49DD|nr:hypothetical protein [Tumebacillus algifaecis]